MQKHAASTLSQAAREASGRIRARERLGLTTPQRRPGHWVSFQESLRERPDAYRVYRNKLRAGVRGDMPARRGSPLMENNMIKAAAYQDELEKVALTPGLSLKMMGSKNRLIRGAGQASARLLGGATPGIARDALNAGLDVGTYYGGRAGAGYGLGHAAASAVRQGAKAVEPKLPQSVKKRVLTVGNRERLNVLSSPDLWGSAASFL